MTTLARTTDPLTSHEAAARVNKEHSQALVLAVFKSGGEYEDRDLVRILAGQCSDSRIRGARKELESQLEVVRTVGNPPRRVWRLKREGWLF